jgi:hypothetical protein
MSIYYISVPQRCSLLSILKDGARCERTVSVFGCFTSKSELQFLGGKQGRGFQRPWRDENIQLAGNKAPDIPEYKQLPSGIISANTCGNVGRNNAVVIATRYGLDGPGIESR